METNPIVGHNLIGIYLKKLVESKMAFGLDILSAESQELLFHGILDIDRSEILDDSIKITLIDIEEECDFFWYKDIESNTSNDGIESMVICTAQSCPSSEDLLWLANHLRGTATKIPPLAVIHHVSQCFVCQKIMDDFFACSFGPNSAEIMDGKYKVIFHIISTNDGDTTCLDCGSSGAASNYHVLLETLIDTTDPRKHFSPDSQVWKEAEQRLKQRVETRRCPKCFKKHLEFVS